MRPRKIISQKNNITYYVCPRPGGGWQVKQEGIRKTIQAFLTQKEAIQFARNLTQESGGKVSIHRQHQKSKKQPISPKPESLRQDDIKMLRGFGCARGLIVIPPEFDDPIEGLEEYI
ncbi:DUF2188 domain-containing protein [Thermosynechococcaceae cyanobacterium BACA0444]|uniref:DUF2188 domain-containing protein n=1 Tax=Pseudocalidococcus azoricus BACA0444 TaxID=2918990 RepID=A0AAE4JXB5_9CYAN|nr:DUF2188 domain-containing protein [Pseudocalidococcus azoricus]MDS3862350.1 DUF2188 domain-containing protein [Pseudocalidococcus azoricus BACA0444]